MRVYNADEVENAFSGMRNALNPTDEDMHKAYARIVLHSITTLEAEPVKFGKWIECDYKTLEHGEIKSAYKAGLCCSECRTGFKKNHMTYKAFCPACGARMEGGIDNG